MPETAREKADAMTENNKYELMLDALTELVPQIRGARKERRSDSEVRRAMQDFLPLPPHSLFLGIANDGLPVLLNIGDAIPGPMLILGDEGSGKSSLLRLIAKATEEVHSAREVQFGVITSRPEEWRSLESSPNLVDIFPAHEAGAAEFIRTLAEWAHSNHKERQSVLMLIDDLSVLMDLEEAAKQDLRWLLLRGPSRRVWPIVTLNPRRAPDVHPWTSFFHTRLYGHVGDPRDLGDLAGGSKPRLESLNAGSEFMLREGSDWLKFWIPPVE